MSLAHRFALCSGPIDLVPKANHAVQLQYRMLSVKLIQFCKDIVIVLILAPISTRQIEWDPDFDQPNSKSSPSEYQPCSLVSSIFCCFFTLIKSLFRNFSCMVSASLTVSKTNSAGPWIISVHASYVWNINGWTNPCWNSLDSTGLRCRSYSRSSTAQLTTQVRSAPIDEHAASPSGSGDSWPHSAVWPSGWIRFFGLETHTKSLIWLTCVSYTNFNNEYIDIDMFKPICSWL